jgi:hypothetical protein
LVEHDAFNRQNFNTTRRVMYPAYGYVAGTSSTAGLRVEKSC